MVQEKKNRLITIVWYGAICLIAALCISCNKNPKDIQKVVNYTGPLIESENIETRYSDSSRLKIKLKAPKQLEMQNGNRVFPNGVDMEFYNETGVVTSTLTANSGIYFKEENTYNVKGNVIIRNLEKKEQLNTEELNWDPETKKVNTDKQVRIETPDQLLTGMGLDATQDFSYYKIRQVQVIKDLDIEEEDGEYEEE